MCERKRCSRSLKRNETGTRKEKKSNNINQSLLTYFIRLMCGPRSRTLQYFGEKKQKLGGKSTQVLE